ncbi:MAG: hypothetical protein HND48_12370 [Chloroflexi bacterium]|nr:hypothetical protein [Chloroflexota bacterium]
MIYGPSGDRIGLTRKVHIPSGEGYHETDFFAGADEYPVHDVHGVPTAVPTCYDQWFPELARIYALNGAAFIFYPTAIGSGFHRSRIRLAGGMDDCHARPCRRQRRIRRRGEPCRRGAWTDVLRQQLRVRPDRTGACAGRP